MTYSFCFIVFMLNFLLDKLFYKPNISYDRLDNKILVHLLCLLIICLKYDSNRKYLSLCYLDVDIFKLRGRHEMCFEY